MWTGFWFSNRTFMNLCCSFSFSFFLFSFSSVEAQPAQHPAPDPHVQPKSLKWLKFRRLCLHTPSLLSLSYLFSLWQVGPPCHIHLLPQVGLKSAPNWAQLKHLACVHVFHWSGADLNCFSRNLWASNKLHRTQLKSLFFRSLYNQATCTKLAP